MSTLEGTILTQLMGFLGNREGTKKDFNMALLQFEKVIHDTAIKQLKVPEELVGKFIQDQIQEIHKLFGQIHAVSKNYQLWDQTSNYFSMSDSSKQGCGLPRQPIMGFLSSSNYISGFSSEDKQLVKDLVAVMENEESVHDFLDTKPYVDHWGGMSEQDFVDLACRIVIDLNTMHEHTDKDNKFMALTPKERIEDLLDLLKKCKGTLYAMWKMSLYEECLKDPRGMQIRFVDNQKNNWLKKAKGRKRKLRDTEIEEQEAETEVHTKKRRPTKSRTEMPLEELGMEYFDDPRGVPLAPPEKPLARKGINASRGSGMPKKIFRGPKHRAIEAIRQANADREAAKSVMGVEETRVRAEDGLEMPLPLTIMTAPDSTIRDTRVVSNLKVFQSSQDTSGISCKNQNTEALKVQAQAVNPKPECSQAIVVPKVVPGLQEYLGAGINNLEAAAVQNSDFDYWDFLLDPRFLGQVGGTGDPLDEFLRTDNNNNQTLLPPTSSRPNNRSLPNRSFSDTGPSITSGPSQSQPFNNIPSRVLSNISEIDNSNREFCHNSTHSRTIPGTQIPQNNFSLVHNTITNPVPPGHQGFNFNEQVLNTISSQSFSTNNSYLSNDEVLSQYTNLDWLQNSGHDSSTTTNTRFPSSTSPTSNTSLNLNSTLPTSKNVEAVALESMTGNEWLDQFDLDFNGDLSLLPF